MPTHPNVIVDDHLKKLVGSANWSLSGSTVTLGSISLDPATQGFLTRGLEQQGYIEKVVNGVVTYVPR